MPDDRRDDTETPARAPWYVPFLFLGGYFVALLYGWALRGLVSTSDFFIQAGLILTAAFGVQIQPPRRRAADTPIQAENVTVATDTATVATTDPQPARRRKRTGTASRGASGKRTRARRSG